MKFPKDTFTEKYGMLMLIALAFVILFALTWASQVKKSEGNRTAGSTDSFQTQRSMDANRAPAPATVAP